MNHDDFNHQISSDSMMAGVFIPNIKQIAGGKLSVNAMLGISDFRGSRKVMTNSAGYSGMRTIGSDYQAKHYVVGASWLKELYQGEMLQTFLNIGADINHQDIDECNGFMYACDHENYRIALLLIEKGINVNAKDRMNMTALMHACREEWKVDYDKILGELFKDPKFTE